MQDKILENGKINLYRDVLNSLRKVHFILK